MGASGSTHGAFQHAVERGNVLLALNLARELGTVSLEDALALTAMLARVGDARYQPAALRWLARYADERRPSVERFAAASALVAALPDEHAAQALQRLVRR